MAFGHSGEYRALSESDVARWVTEWQDHGLLSWDMFQILGMLAIAAVPFFTLYWAWFMVIFSSRFRVYIRSGENGMPIVTFAFALFCMTAIMNDIFFAIFFRGPLWAAYYHVMGAESAIAFENAVVYFSAIGILFGAWS